MNEKNWESGDHYIVFGSSDHSLQVKTTELLKTSLWRVANIAAPIGCGSTMRTIQRVGGERGKTEPHF